MADFWDAHILVKIFCSVFLLGLTVHVIGFSTPHWSDNGQLHNGLWKFCDNDGVCADVVDAYYRKILNDITWFEATQAFEMIGVIAGLVGLILIILYVFVTKTAGNRTVYLIALAAISVACGGTILGVIIYGSQSVHLSWSFGLTIVGGVIYGLTVGLMIMHIVRN